MFRGNPRSSLRKTGERRRKEDSPLLATTRASTVLLQPLKFGFHCFAAGTFIDFRRRTVMDAAFIVIVERLPPSFSLPLSLRPSILFPSNEEIPSTRLKFDFHLRKSSRFHSYSSFSRNNTTLSKIFNLTLSTLYFILFTIFVILL